MRTGIIFEIKNNKAVIMQTGGSFVSVDAEAGWGKGDVVSFKTGHFSMKSLKPLYTAAACFVLALLVGVGGHNLYFTETSIISIDINPSFEMGINKFDRVIRVSGYNGDGLEVLNSVNLRHKVYTEAINDLLTNESLAAYLETEEEEVWVKVAVHSGTAEKSDTISETIIKEVESLPVQQQALKVECEIVTQELIYEARAHDMTPGKYAEIIELQELVPEIAIDDYRDKSIRELKEIKRPIVKRILEERQSRKENNNKENNNKENNKKDNDKKNEEPAEKDDDDENKENPAVRDADKKEEKPAEKDGGNKKEEQAKKVAKWKEEQAEKLEKKKEELAQKVEKKKEELEQKLEKRKEEQALKEEKRKEEQALKEEKRKEEQAKKEEEKRKKEEQKKEEQAKKEEEKKKKDNKKNNNNKQGNDN